MRVGQTQQTMHAVRVCAAVPLFPSRCHDTRFPLHPSPSALQTIAQHPLRRFPRTFLSCAALQVGVYRALLFLPRPLRRNLCVESIVMREQYTRRGCTRSCGCAARPRQLFVAEHTPGGARGFDVLQGDVRSNCKNTQVTIN